MSRGALIAAAAAVVVACSNAEMSKTPATSGQQPPPPAATPVDSPVVKPTTPPVATHRPSHGGAAGADHGSWATGGDSIPPALKAPCARIDSLVRSVADAAPPSTKLRQVAGPRPVAFRYQHATAESGGCEFVARGADTAASDGLFDAMKQAFEKAGWSSMGGSYSADGPDGSDVGYSKDGLMCVVEGRWDGGDDSAPAIKPRPDFDVFVTCAPLRADDRPPQ